MNEAHSFNYCLLLLYDLIWHVYSVHIHKSCCLQELFAISNVSCNDCSLSRKVFIKSRWAAHYAQNSHYKNKQTIVCNGCTGTAGSLHGNIFLGLHVDIWKESVGSPTDFGGNNILIWISTNKSHRWTKTNNKLCLLTLKSVNSEPDFPYSSAPQV